MIGIIGFGRFGALTARYLARDLAVLVLDSGTKDQAIRAVGAAPASLEEICRQEIVVLCVPISTLRDHLRRIAPLLGPDTLVADVCSVKVLPVRWMREILPPATPILATHPMFGPDSAADTLAGRKIVVCRERIDGPRYESIREWLTRQGLEIIETTAEVHDEQIAVSLALTHFIGRSLAVFGGLGYDAQERFIRNGVDVVAATPGRLIDFIRKGTLDISQVEILVIDEADRMLDMGFIPDIRRICKELPDKRQSMLFSATLSREIEDLARNIVKNPVRIEISPDKPTVEKISQKVAFVDLEIFSECF